MQARLPLLVGACAAASIAGCTTPPREAAIGGVQFLPEMSSEPQQAARVLYQDGALATPVPDGTLWTFGDTFLGTRAPDAKPHFEGGAHSNTMAFLPAGSTGWPPALRYLTGPDGVALPPLALLPDEDPKTRRLWPLAGVWLAGADNRNDATDFGRAYMFYGLIDVTGGGPWGFKPVGTGLARAPHAFSEYLRLPQPQDATGNWPIDPSAIVEQHGYLYLYAPRRFRGEQDLSSELLIARVDEHDIEDPDRYEFFAGFGGDDDTEALWTKRIEDALPAAPEVWGQASVAWNDHLKAWLLATSSNFFRHDQIQLRRAPTPWGPWTPLAPDGGLIKVPERAGEETQLIYCTMLHPELDEDSGRVITLTFCRMLKRDWALTSPEGVRVELQPGAR